MQKHPLPETTKGACQLDYSLSYRSPAHAEKLKSYHDVSNLFTDVFTGVRGDCFMSRAGEQTCNSFAELKKIPSLCAEKARLIHVQEKHKGVYACI